MGQHRIHQVTHAAVVLGRHGKEGESETCKLGGARLMLRLVALVDRDHTGHTALADDAGDLFVQRMHALLHVYHQDRHGGIIKRRVHLGADARLNGVLAAFGIEHHHAAGVHQLKAFIVPLHLAHQPVAGHAALVVHDRDPASRDAVEDGGLADVGASDNHNHPVFCRLCLLGNHAP